MNIRNASSRDEDFCLYIDKLFFESHIVAVDGAFVDKIWRGYLRGDLKRTFVLESSETTRAGYYRYSIENESQTSFAYLRVIAVTPPFQNRGLGEMLYRDFENAVRSINISLIRLSCPNYLRAVSWYQHLGFKLRHKDDLAHYFEKDLNLEK